MNEQDISQASNLLNQKVNYDFILKNYVGQFGKWQFMVLMFFFITTASPYLLFATFGNHMSPHYCRVDALNNANWTMDQKRNLSIPEKPVDETPMRGQPYLPCARYKLPYNDLANMNFEEALRKRNDLLGEAINSSDNLESCPEGRIFDTRNSDFAYSIVTDFDLVCERSYLDSLSISIYFLGMLVGLAPWGAVADKIGRYKVLLFCNAALIVVGMSVSAAPNYTVFVILRFFTAILTNGHFNSFYVLVLEVVGVRQRNLTGFYMLLFYLMSYCYLVGTAYMSRNWRVFHATLGSGPCFIFLLYFIDESPRWLMATGQTEKSIKILRKASKMNRKKQWPEDIHLDAIHQENDEELRNTCTQRVKNAFSGFIDLVKTPETRKRTFLQCYIWFAVSAVYFGFTFYNVKLKGNIFLIVLLSILMRIPASIFQVIAYDRIGRKYPLIFSLGLCTIISMVMGILHIAEDTTGAEYSKALIGLGTTASAVVSACFTMIYVYTPELYPTILRNVGMGSCSTVARLGAVLAPFINQLRDNGQTYAPMFIYGVMSLLATIAVFFLPETLRAKMPETVEELEDCKKDERKDKTRSADEKESNL